jgi:threonine/homoserine/homoserine lactone efflux protein
MDDYLPAAPLLAAFLAASLALALTPGPGVAYIVARSLTEGRRAGLVSVLGVALGNLANACAAATGLAALFALSSVLFDLVRYAGALYLVYLGWRMWRVAPGAAGNALNASRTRGAFRDGVVTALLNPKTTLFFAAFLPQFLPPNVAPMTGGLCLGALFVGIAALTDTAYALAAGAVAARLARSRRAARLGQRLGGGMFIGLGICAAVCGGRAAR